MGRRSKGSVGLVLKMDAGDVVRVRIGGETVLIRRLTSDRLGLKAPRSVQIDRIPEAEAVAISEAEEKRSDPVIEVARDPAKFRVPGVVG